MISCYTWASHPAKLTLVYGSGRQNVLPNMNMLPFMLMPFSLHVINLQSSLIPLKGSTTSKLRERDHLNTIFGVITTWTQMAPLLHNPKVYLQDPRLLPSDVPW